MTKLKLGQVKPLIYDDKTKKLIFEYGYTKYEGLIKDKTIYNIKPFIEKTSVSFKERTP